ncbi:MAG: hypothetical protein CHACPFDD_03496 [Phycisphaerae bacterium]|nr:hypothetical protein [Phycisphaerae bacterium]
MGIWDKLRGELIDIIEWLDSSHDTMVYRFERYNNEIKHGAKLVVREGQAAAFVNEGRLADVFSPGTYALETRNLPLLATLMGWAHGFESPFKAEVYFVSTRQFTDLKWGTKNPLMLRDAEFGPVRLRAFGTYALRVADPARFLREVVGTGGRFHTDDITEQLRSLIASRFADIVGESRIPVLDLAANYDELAKFIVTRMGADFESFGLELPRLVIENISLPPAVEEALDKRSSMGIVGNLGAYTQFQAANAVEASARTPGGAAGGAMNAGLGVALGAEMARTISAAASGTAGAASGTPASPAGPPPLPGALSLFIAVDGRQVGPLDEQGVREAIRSGRLTRETLIWQTGMAEWAKAGTSNTLAPHFASMPPPPPK